MAKKNKNSAEKLETAKRIASQGKAVQSAYMGIEETAFRFFRWVSSLIDRIFFSKRYLGFFALLVACLMFFVVNYDENSFASTLSSSKTISNVSVTTRYNSETFEVSGVPASCDVVITGDAANVNNASTRSGYCLINLEGYTEGTHLVSISAVGYGDNVSTVVSPNETQVTLKKKTTMQFDLSYDYINQNQLDSRYILGEPTFPSGSKINIRASQDTLNSIALVKALIDVSGQTTDFTVDAPLVAYDRYGNVVNAEIVPNTVSAQVTLTSPSKTVPINLNVTGEPTYGFSVDTITYDHHTATIYAPESVLNTIEELTVSYDLTNAGADSDVQVPVTLPAGVSSSDVTMVNLHIKMEQSTTTTFENIDIKYRNNDKQWGVSDYDTLTVNVTLTGSRGNLENITRNDITVYFDVGGIEEPGTYNLPLQVEPISPYVGISLDRIDINITLVSRE